MIEAFRFDEGDRIEKGEVVVEISKEKYQLLHEEAQEHLKAVELALKRAEEELKVKHGVYSQEATTRQEVLRAEAEAEIGRARVDEAVKRLAIARLNLDQCVIKAPFTGYLAVRHQQPFETVNRSAKLFQLVDNASVYAVGHVTEAVLARLKKGDTATFVRASGKRSAGKIAKIGTLVDPKSGTGKIQVLLENPNSDLVIGAVGKLEVER